MKENNKKRVCYLIVSHTGVVHDSSQSSGYCFWNNILAKDIDKVFDIVCAKKQQSPTSMPSGIDDDYWWDVLKKRWMLLLMVSPV
ncbi:MAG: hypothetical protein JXB88_16745 [Spirochaetales bacterium]|nr:hypothetical protein [Spirochaetales bacterium]